MEGRAERGRWRPRGLPFLCARAPRQPGRVVSQNVRREMLRESWAWGRSKDSAAWLAAKRCPLPVTAASCGFLSARSAPLQCPLPPGSGPAGHRAAPLGLAMGTHGTPRLQTGITCSPSKPLSTFSCVFCAVFQVYFPPGPCPTPLTGSEPVSGFDSLHFWSLQATVDPSLDRPASQPGSQDPTVGSGALGVAQLVMWPLASPG